MTLIPTEYDEDCDYAPGGELDELFEQGMAELTSPSKKEARPLEEPVETVPVEPEEALRRLQQQRLRYEYATGQVAEPEEALRRLQQQLDAVQTRDEGYRLVKEALPRKASLFAFARFLDLPVQKKDKIVAFTVGRRLNSETIRGGYSATEPR